jgi:GNAT superfamily N-acetyltransferase
MLSLEIEKLASYPRAMVIRKLEAGDDMVAASILAKLEHDRLRAQLPFLPERGAGDFRGRIEWMLREGIVLGSFESDNPSKGSLAAFLGGFVIEDFRNLGPGAFCPDWCHGAADPALAFRAYRELYRALAPAWRLEGASIHAACAYATDREAIDAFGLTGFGRIMMDACSPTSRVVSSLARLGSRAKTPNGLRIRRALISDAPSLAELDAGLALHIAASPVLMPRTRGRDEAEWLEWLSVEDAVAFVAEAAAAAAGRGALLGFMKAEAPQFDVSYVVHGGDTLAIDGLFVPPEERGRGIAASLLAAMAGEASAAGKGLMSVDCETMNPEAYAFWPRFFEPLAWGFERRT